MDIEIRIAAEFRDDETKIKNAIAEKVGFTTEDVTTYQLLRCSLDARGMNPIYQMRFKVNEPKFDAPPISKNYKPVHNATPVIVVGAGPAGYFAALELIELGFKPIVLERGKDARARRRDLKAIQIYGQVVPNSNYCFGEGGAGTYSDGKLYTRSHKRGSIEKSLLLLVEHGASSDILVEAHPHIGSNKLPQVVQNMRATIEACGGEVYFEHQVTDFILGVRNQVSGVKCIVSSQGSVVSGEKQENHSPPTTEKEFFASAVILAVGHSARDIYALLQKRGIYTEAKPFALGVRIEHPQPMIDEIQYKKKKSEFLPPAAYSLVTQVETRGVFSFCMCPGGLIVPAATSPGEIVVNGMSMSRRDSPYANSGVVVQLEVEDTLSGEGRVERGEKHETLSTLHSPLSTLNFQSKVERDFFNAGDGSQRAPAQRLTDFVKRKVSSDLKSTSYIPGIFSAPVHSILPPFIFKKLQQGILNFEKLMRGYLTEEAQVIGVESRTSAPVKIPRDPKTLMHISCEGLFPCGEGAGYAGGIISAAMDGQNVAKAVAKWYRESGIRSQV